MLANAMPPEHLDAHALRQELESADAAEGR
jgi:hypothetical protein